MKPHPAIGQHKLELDTPALCLDIDRLEANIARMAKICREHGISWRPHMKGHKCGEVARRQLAAGAIGVTCAKLGEAEVMADEQVGDLLIANLIAGPVKLERLVALCRRADPIVTVDHRDQIDPLAAACQRGAVRPRVVIEVNLGLDRAGVAPGEAAVHLAQYVDRHPSLRLVGIMGYEGHLLTVDDPTEKRDKISKALAVLAETADEIRRANLNCEIVSAGGTGSYATAVACPGITELQAGGLVFMDNFYRERCRVDAFDDALTLVATVVSRPVPERAILDAGRKSQNAEIHRPRVVGFPSIELDQLSAEHARLRLPAEAQHLRIGDRVELVPGYADFTCVLHDEFFVCRNDRVIDVWQLTARGKIR